MSEEEIPGGLRAAIRRTLQVGVAAACFFLLIGIGIMIHTGGASVHASAARTSLDSLPGELAGGNAQGFLLLGVVILVLTPLARVVLSLGIFARAEDVPFALITLFVLVVLSIGLVLGVVP